VRAYAWHHTTALFNDGPIFIYIAEAIVDGDWPAVFRHPYHPLYPLAIAALDSWVGSLERAAVLVSMATGTAAVGALYLFLREAFGEREALLGGGILALHPTFVDFSSDVQSEGLYVLCFLAAVWLIWRGLSRGEARWAALGGLAIGLAYLTRPEGLLLCVPALGLAGYQQWRRRWKPAAALAWVGALAAGIAIAAVPYVGAIRAATGHWAITQKYSAVQVAALIGSETSANPEWRVAARAGTPAVEPGADPGAAAAPRRIPLVELAPRLGDAEPAEPKSAIARGLRALDELTGAAASGLRFSLLPFVLIGVLAGRGAYGLRDGYVAAIAAWYGVVLYGLALGAGYVSRRHALPPLLPTLGYAALGLPIAGGFLLDLWEGRRAGPGLAAGRRLRASALLGFAIFLLFALPRDLRERRSGRLAHRQAAEWLRGEPHDRGAVAAGRLRVAYYAGETFVPLPAGQGGDVLIYLQKRRVRYVIVDEKRLSELADLKKAVGRELQLLHRSEARGDKVAVYRLEEPP
jgi:hypothetical protein